MRHRDIAVTAAALLATTFAGIGGVTPAGATGVSPAAAFQCNGPLPGGTYAAVIVTGTCVVNDGNVIVTGNLQVSAGKVLNAAFAKNDVGGSGTSSLTVHGNLAVLSGAVAFLGCEPGFFSCLDDPNQGSPTLSDSTVVSGNLTAGQALTVVLHNSKITGDVQFLGGGGGASECFNEGPDHIPGNSTAVQFMNGNGIPPYFDNEDNTVGGNVWLENIATCWTGSLRNKVGGSFVDMNNAMADPDAGEVLANQVAGNLICVGNNPATQFGDSGSTSNTVGGAAVGQCAFSVKKPNPAPVPGQNPPGPLQAISVPATKPQGYVLGGGDGGVFAFGTHFYGSAPGTNEIFNFAGIATAPGGGGYWIVNGSGHVVGFGPNAPSWGDAAASILAAPMVGLAASPFGDGYYEAASDGGVFNYGLGTRFYGSAGAVHLAQPISGIAATAAGDGYYLVAKDGGVFSYGPGARFHGSLGAIKLAGAIVGMAVDPVTGGYWLVGADGGVFSFDAPYMGSLGNVHLTQPIVGMVAAPAGNGYYLVGKDGGVFAFGPGAHYQGSLGGITLNQPVDGMALG